jgi:peroxiredoxin
MTRKKIINNLFKSTALMKKFLWVLLIAVPCMGLARQQPNYEITGKLVGIDDVAMVYLAHTDGMYIQVMDSAAVAGHVYHLKGHVAIGQQAFLSTYNVKQTKLLPKNAAVAVIFLSPGKFNISHNKKFQDFTITGSAAYDDYAKLLAAAKPYTDNYAALNAKSHLLLEKVYGGFIKAHPQSPVAFFALTEFARIGHSTDDIKLKPYFELLPQNIKETNAGKELYKRINDAIIFDTKGAVGSQATDFTLLDTAGRAIKLSDFKGKYLLLDFWSSSCVPCRADNPHLVAAYKQFHAKGFDILSVSLDVKSREKAWLAAIDDDHLTAWTHVADLQHDVNTNTVIGIYGVSSIPKNFLIDPSGKIIARSLRDGDLEKQLSQLLSN